MASGKKGKKTKWSPANITDIIAEPTTIATTKSWADGIEDAPETSSYSLSSRRNPPGPVVLPSASRAARGGLTVDDDSIPRNPPYSAYICNLPYDVDESAISDLFSGLRIQNLRLPREGDRLKGYGYIDFEDRESLVGAMNIIDPTINGRKIRIDVSTQDNERRMGGARTGRMGERDYDPERTSGDWRSGPRTEVSEAPRSRGMDRGSMRERDRDQDGSTGEPARSGAWREGERPAPEPPRTGYGGRDSYGRDRGGFEDRERGYGRDGFRDGDRDRGYGRDGFRPAPDRDRFSRDGDRSGSRGFGERRGFSDRDREQELPREGTEETPRERPKLNLLPRTVPLERPAQDKGEGEAEGDEQRKAAVFGGAKPVDTAAKEREIEERLKKQEEEARQKAEEGQRWGRRVDDRGPLRRNDDRSRDSRSYNTRDRNDYSRDKDRDYSRDKDRDYARDKDRDHRDNRNSREMPRDRDYARDGSPDKREFSQDEREDSRKKVQDEAPQPREEDAKEGKSTETSENGECTDRSRDKKNADEVIMPQLKEKQAPNFAITNKFSCLEDAGGDESD